MGPAADAYIFSALPANNYGSAPTLGVGRQSERALSRSLIRFDLSSIPSDATVLSAGFRAYLVGATESPRELDVELMGVDTAWGETTVTWSTPLDYTETEDVLAVGTPAGYYSWDVTSLVRAWVSGGARSNYGLALWSADEDLLGWRGFASREYAVVAPLPPQLEVVYLP